MSVTQTVEIPVNHRLTIDVPPEVPAGQAKIRFFPVSAGKEPVQRSEARDSEIINKNADNSLTPHTDALLNILSKLGDINIDEIRDERLAKHL
jgi:hypothetical protein